MRRGHEFTVARMNEFPMNIMIHEWYIETIHGTQTDITPNITSPLT